MLASSVFGVLSWFTPIILGFVSTPVLVKGLGTEAYGVYALIVGFLTYSFTFGIGKAAAKYAAEYSASGESERLSNSLSAVLIFSVVVGVLGALALALLTPWMVANVLLLSESQRPAAETGLYIACITGLLNMISLVFQNMLQGSHRFGTYLLFSSLSSLLLSTGNIVLAVAGYGIEVLIAWNLFSVLVSGAVFCAAAVHAVPEFRPSLNVGRDAARAAMKYGGSIILYQVFANALLLLERAIVVRQFGAEALTYYWVPMMLGMYLHSGVGSFVLALFPRMNELLNDREQLIRLYVRSTRLVIAAVVLVAISLIICGSEFLTIWVGSDVSSRSSTVLIFHVMTFSLFAAMAVGWNISETFHAAGLNVAITFILLAVGGTLMLTVGDEYGIEGIAASRLAGTVITVPVIAYVEKRFLGFFQAKHWIWLGSRVGAAAIILAGFQVLTARFLPFGLPQLLVSISGGIAVYGVMLFLTGFFEDAEIERVRGFFSRKEKTGA